MTLALVVGPPNNFNPPTALPTETYKISVKDMLEEGTIRISNGDEIEQFYEVGARISVRWTRAEIGDTNWRAGWYVAEVQESDPEHDEITVQFVS